MSASKKSEFLYELFLKKIVGNEWEVGKRIPGEVSLAEELGVSRNTVRDALQKLVMIGIIEKRHGSGNFLVRKLKLEPSFDIQPFRTLTKERIINVLEFRRTVEAESAYLAAQRRTPQDLDLIENSVTSMQMNLDNPKRYSEADLTFHLYIALATQNSLFYDSLISMQSLLTNHFVEMNEVIGTEFSILDHLNVFRAIKQQEPDLAKTIMYHTINRTIRLLMATTVRIQ